MSCIRRNLFEDLLSLIFSLVFLGSTVSVVDAQPHHAAAESRQTNHS